MADIHFYHLTATPLDRALPKLLEKALQGGYRILIRAGSQDKAEALNALLWMYDPASFLPHGTTGDGRSGQQPVFIAGNKENPNQATLLLVADGSEMEPGEAFARVLDVFDGNREDELASARARWKRYRETGHVVSYVRQNERGGWEKQDA